MKQFYNFLVNRHQDIFRYLLIISSIALITYWLPSTGKFKYDFEKGRPWKHETLFAPFDFPILKSEGELELEKAELLNNFRPFYKLKPQIAERRKQQFKVEYSKKYKKFRTDSTIKGNLLYLLKKTFNGKRADSLKHLAQGEALLSIIYSKGVINLNEAHSDFTGEDQIQVLKNNISSLHRVKEYFKIGDAYKLIIDTLSNQSGSFMIPLLEDAVTFNIEYDDSITQKLKTDLLINISTTRGKIQEGENIISTGNIVTDEKFQILQSLKKEYEKNIGGEEKGYLILLGYFLITAVSLTVLSIFLAFFEPEVFNSINKMIFILLLITLFTYLTSLAVSLEIPSYYLIPYCIIPIVTRTFFGTRLALFTHLTILFIIGFIIPLGVEFQFVQLVAGIIAIFTNVKAHYWSQFFVSIALVFTTYIVSYFGVSLLQEGSFQTIEWVNFGWLGINIFFTLLAYPLIPIFEKVFGFISSITLVELADLNKKLLKDLSLKAPGTFQHSLQVANLAEAAAFEVGANTLLVRVGALYHDVGKMEKPQYFIENQISEVNPHDDIPFEESARIIINHVTLGIEMAKRQNLPDILVDFIRTHHGTSRVEYFYQSFLKNYPEKEVDENVFRYPGPLPYSKETAVVMLADSVEAASKSLKSPTAEDIDNLVEKIFLHKIEQQQLINCDLTFKDITKIKKIFKKMLKSIYHVRIAYPEATK